MIFSSKKLEELKLVNAQLKKENVELAHRIKETRNQLVIMQTNFDAQMDVLKTTFTASLTQMDKVLKETLDRMHKDSAGFTAPRYINEDY